MTWRKNRNTTESADADRREVTVDAQRIPVEHDYVNPVGPNVLDRCFSELRYMPGGTGLTEDNFS